MSKINWSERLKKLRQRRGEDENGKPVKEPVAESKLLVESLLDGDPKERSYAQLQTLFQKRSELHREQKHVAEFSMMLHRLGYTEDQVENYDVQHTPGGTFIVGFWLKEGDYKGKVNRIAKARAASSQRVASDDTTHRWQRPQGSPTNVARREVSAYYVPVEPPLLIPAHLT